MQHISSRCNQITHIQPRLSERHRESVPGGSSFFGIAGAAMMLPLIMAEATLLHRRRSNVDLHVSTMQDPLEKHLAVAGQGRGGCCWIYG